MRFPFHETDEINVHYTNLKTMYIHDMIEIYKMDIHFMISTITQSECNLYIHLGFIMMLTI